MPAYRVVTTTSELPFGTFFTTINRYPIKDGALVLVRIGDSLWIGRLLKNIAGLDWLRMPGQWVPIIGQVIIEILGEIVMLDNLRPCWN